jgi:hypothetical protein
MFSYSSSAGTVGSDNDFFGAGGGEDSMAARAPTAKQLNFAAKLSAGAPIPPEALLSSAALSLYIDTALQTSANTNPRAYATGSRGMDMNGPASFDGEYGGGGAVRQPTAKQLAFASRLAAGQGRAIPPQALASSEAISQFIEAALQLQQQQQQQSPSQGGVSGAGMASTGGEAMAARPPSDRQAAFVRKLAGERGMALPADALANAAAASAFIDSILQKAPR